MHIRSVGHLLFAATMIALGIMGLVNSSFTGIWQGVPASTPAREALAYVCAIISLVCGIGLLWRRTAAPAARLLLAYISLWWLLFRLRSIFRAPAAQDSWSGCGETAVIVAAAWVLYAWFASDWDTRHLRFVTGDNGLRFARLIYALAMIPFGIAHFHYPKETANLVPGYLPWHMFWAYFFGCTFIAAGIGMLFGVCARMAAALSVLQLGLFTLLVWFPIIGAGAKSPFVWSETEISVALTVAAWVVADSYRGIPWLAMNRR